MRTRFCIWPIVTLLFAFAAAVPAGATTFTVNVTDDTDDGTCNAAHCSLREALTAAQSATGAPHVVNFNIPGGGVRTITIPVANGRLPFLVQAVTIDGYTQPGSSPNTNVSGAINAVPLIELRGPGVPSGFVVGAGPVVIRGVVINGFSQQIEMFAGGLTVRGSFIGTTADGLADAFPGPDDTGIGVSAGSVTVGGPAAADRNLLSGNRVAINAGLAPFSGILAVVRGNLIGTNRLGTAAIPNQ